MAINFILCRRRDDHSVTHMLAERALAAWPEWEAVPEADIPKPAPRRRPHQAPPESPASEPTAEPVTDKPASKSRPRAAMDNRE